MQPISKQDMELLIKNNVLTQNSAGRYKEELVVTGKYGNARGKQRYAPTPLFNKLMFIKTKEVFDINKVKDNQKYMFKEKSQGVS